MVIFTEGTSHRVLSNELTPNAMALANKSLCFNNYFSHTAATFRGLRGQLMSGYQLRGGYYQDKSGLGQMSKERMKTVLRKDINIISIAKNHGYATYFASPHRTPDPFNSFLEYIGFDNVISYKNDSDISDKELYQNLTELAVKVHTSRKKFFLATYVVGSHHGYDSPDLKYGDGSNSYLNKFHNQDHWFGQFLQKLEATGVLENTLLVYTSDHATYPSAEFRKTFQSDAPYFADRIPLFIYTKGITPRTVDACNQNSLCLAPTLLDLLDLRNEENCFLGNSLFSRNIGEFSRLTNIGFDFFDTSGGRVVPIKPEPPVLEKVKAFFNIFG
ncbi:LTA synthase family protein [Mailhella sp.]|uniref:LTA synthase family protein n=1 Tax=Mailhella sp. TaxID=1981029 RepID=UPI0040647FF2